MPLPLSKLCVDYDDRIAVFRALGAPVSKVSIADICSRAGVSRKRFYALFSGKEDVFRWFLDLCFEASLYEIGRSLTWREGVEACLHYVAGERAVFEASFRDQVAPPSRYWPLNQARIRRMRETLVEKGVAVDEALEIEMGLYSSNVPQLIRMWIESDGDLALADFATCWIDCVPSRLRDALERA